MTQLYDDLGVPPDATPDAIKAAHRRAVKRNHPDTGGDPDAFRRVQHAYDVLGSPERRERYDRTGEDDLRDPAAILDGKAREYFSMMLGEILDPNNAWAFRRDFIAVAKSRVKREHDSTKSEMKALRRRQEHAEKISERFKSKGKGRLPQDAIAHMIRQLDRGMAMLEDRQELLERVDELLDEYEFEHDESPAPATESEQDRMNRILEQSMRNAGLF